MKKTVKVRAEKLLYIKCTGYQKSLVINKLIKLTPTNVAICHVVLLTKKLNMKANKAPMANQIDTKLTVVNSKQIKTINTIIQVKLINFTS